MNPIEMLNETMAMLLTGRLDPAGTFLRDVRALVSDLGPQGYEIRLRGEVIGRGPFSFCNRYPALREARVPADLFRHMVEDMVRSISYGLRKDALVSV